MNFGLDLDKNTFDAELVKSAERENNRVDEILNNNKRLKLKMYLLIMILCLMLLVLGVIYTNRKVSYPSKYREEKTVEIESSIFDSKDANKLRVVDVESLKSKNQDVIGWVETDDKVGSYVMKDKSYLTKDIKGDYKQNGSVYKDDTVTTIFTPLFANNCNGILRKKNDKVKYYELNGHYIYNKVLEFDLKNFDEFKNELDKENTYDGFYKILKEKYGLNKDFKFNGSCLVVFVSKGDVTNLELAQKVLVYDMNNYVIYKGGGK